MSRRGLESHATLLSPAVIGEAPVRHPVHTLMRRAVKFIVAGLVAFAVSLMLFLPASFVSRWLPPGVETGVLTGTIWNGACDSLRVAGHSLGAARWKVRPLQLLRGRLVVDTHLVRTAGGATGLVTLRPDGRVRIEDLDLRSLLADLPSHIAPRNWKGEVQMKLAELEITGGAIASVVGTIEAHDLVAAPNGIGLGSYRATFDPEAAPGDPVVGRFQDLGGPMEVAGTITLKPDRRVLVEGRVKARAGAPPEITRELEALRYLGQPDGQGRLPFTIENSY